MPTKIEWTDETWNPVVGCTKVSEGCQNCYAERMMYRQVCMGAARHEKNPDSNEDTWEAYSSVMDEDTHKWNGSVALRPEILDQPLHWHNPRQIFVCSMSDLFHESVPFEFIEKVLRVIEQCEQHTFQILTKRPEIAYDFFGGTSGAGLSAPPLKNVWLGVTCENQKCADERIPILLQIPAAHRFVSLEPLLGEVDLNKRELICKIWRKGLTIGTYLDWVIIGCESGPKRRPCKLEWVRNIAQQGKAAGVPVFVKQLNINGKVSHDPSEWPEDLRIR